MFEHQAAQTPGVVALSAEGQGDITYAELDQQVNALAERLRLAGVAPRTHVALLARSGYRHVAGMLAALKCGSSFATLDVDEPASRQEQIIIDLAPSALLYDPAFERAATQLRLECPRLETTWAVTAAEPPTVEISPADAAFVAYTSGSTGRPKGIVQSHRSFTQFLRWFGTAFNFGPGTRLAQWAAPTYDAAYCEILGGLLFGATVCPVPPHVRNDSSTFLHWAKRSRITVIETVPSYASRLLLEIKSTDTQIWDDLRYVLLAGEELTVQLARGLKEVLPPGVEIYNLYGPSECVLATYHRITPADLQAEAIPIGRAIDGRELVVIDPTGADCGPGVPGEIRIRSEFLADGYLHDEAQTARVFVNINDAESVSTLRELRTGDLGRWRASGELEWLGRRDNMVKRRGVRIELEEVERRLRMLSDISECAVVALQPSSSDGQTRLVAHVVPATGTEPRIGPDGPQVIRRQATAILPTQLIPDEFILSSGLPKLPNGKLDRGALASIAALEPASSDIESGGLTRIEEEISNIFSEALGIAAIGVDEDFFNLGGHSLLAMTMLSRIRGTTGADLPMLAIFRHPTIRQLAALIESKNPSLASAPSGTHVGEQRESSSPPDSGIGLPVTV